jgi:hypothetical protein
MFVLLVRAPLGKFAGPIKPDELLGRVDIGPGESAAAASFIVFITQRFLIVIWHDESGCRSRATA